MKLKYALTKEDFLINSLFIASTKESVRSARNKSRITIPVIMFIFAIYIFINSSYPFLEIVYLLIGILWYVFYPKYSASRYKKHYAKSITESYKGKIGILSTLELNQNHLLSVSKIGESKINLNQINEINEIPTHILIRLSHGETLILPKDREIEEGNVKVFIENLVSVTNLKITNNLNWRWK